LTDAPDCRACPASDELRGSEERCGREEAIDQASDGTIDVADAEVDTDLAGSQALERGLDLFGVCTR
jgi:hypothetical protein